MAKKLVKKRLRKRKPGRPLDKIKTPELVDAIRRYIIEHHPTVAVLCRTFNITKQTFYRWQKEDKDLKAAIDEAREISDHLLAEKARCSLEKLVKGIRWKEKTREAVPVLVSKKSKKTKPGALVLTKTVTKFIPPSERAIEFALKNVEPDKWKDKHEVEHSGGLVVQVVNYADTVAPQLPAEAVSSPDSASDRLRGKAGGGRVAPARRQG